MIYLTGDTHIPIDIDKLSCKSFPEQREMTRSDYVIVRGEIFEIDGSTFFTLGGAVSYDKVFRVEGISWWPQERPSWADFSHGIENLARHNNRVDYILTHTAPATILQVLRLYTRSWDSAADRSVENALQAIDNDIYYKGWYFGHWHLDFDYKCYHALYNRVVRLQ